MSKRYENDFYDGDWDDDYESTLDERYERKYARMAEETERLYRLTVRG